MTEEEVYYLTFKGFLCTFIGEDLAEMMCNKLALRQLKECDKNEHPAIIYEDDKWVFRTVTKKEEE